MNPESLIVPCNRLRYSFHCRFEIVMTRVDVEPLSQNVVPRQLRELFDDCGVTRTLRADQDAMPLPPPRAGWFDQDHHLAAEHVNGQSTKHPLREECRVVLQVLKDPFVIERFHVNRAATRLASSDRSAEPCARRSSIPRPTAHQPAVRQSVRATFHTAT